MLSIKCKVSLGSWPFVIAIFTCAAETKFTVYKTKPSKNLNCEFFSDWNVHSLTSL